LIMLAAMSLPVIGVADRLSTPFVEVVVAEVPVGMPYDLAAHRQPRIELLNQSQAPLSLEISALVPRAEQLKGSAQPIPSLAWISLKPDHLLIDEHDEATCNVVLTIPNERRYRKKTYQVMIWSRSMPKSGGLTVGAGVLSRLIFTTR
jgi:hypothetical protein